MNSDQEDNGSDLEIRIESALSFDGYVIRAGERILAVARTLAEAETIRDRIESARDQSSKA